jgi:2',3'-cyclic-nucleotide 2'-phosphodiesterase (5'-nucleotidase family)
LANFSQNINRTYPILGCNVDASKEPLLAGVIQPYTIITTPSGIRVSFDTVSCLCQFANLAVQRQGLARRVQLRFGIIKCCVQVGVVGFTTPDTPFLSSPGPTITFLPLYPSVQNAVNEVHLHAVSRVN